LALLMSSLLVAQFHRRPDAYGIQTIAVCTSRAPCFAATAPRYRKWFPARVSAEFGDVHTFWNVLVSWGSRSRLPAY
jgi:hypothetical protein